MQASAAGALVFASCWFQVHRGCRRAANPGPRGRIALGIWEELLCIPWIHRCMDAFRSASRSIALPIIILNSQLSILNCDPMRHIASRLLLMLPILWIDLHAHVPDGRCDPGQPVSADRPADRAGDPAGLQARYHIDNNWRYYWQYLGACSGSISDPAFNIATGPARRSSPRRCRSPLRWGLWPSCLRCSSACPSACSVRSAATPGSMSRRWCLCLSASRCRRL